MHLILPFPEAVELALRGGALPALVSSLTCAGTTVRADLDLRAVPSPPFALRAVAAVAPVVRVHATFRSFDAGKATFDLTVRAASLPVQRLLNQLTGLLNSQLRSRQLPEGLIAIKQGGSGEPLVVLDLQLAAGLRTDGVTVTRFAINEGEIELAATVHGLVVRAA